MEGGFQVPVKSTSGFGFRVSGFGFRISAQTNVSQEDVGRTVGDKNEWT
jgi:hypothetical protein